MAVWIKKELLEDKPDEIIAELKIIDQEKAQLKQRVVALRNAKGGLLAQENRVREELAREQRYLGNVIAERLQIELQAKIKGLEAQLQALIDGNQPKKIEFDREIDKLLKQEKKLADKRQELEAELSHYHLLDS